MSLKDIQTQLIETWDKPSHPRESQLGFLQWHVRDRRISSVRTGLPLTFDLVHQADPGLARRFFDHVSCRRSENVVLQEAAQFAEWISSHKPLLERLPFLADVVAYEQAKLAAISRINTPETPFLQSQVLHYSYRFDRIVNWVFGQELPTASGEHSDVLLLALSGDIPIGTLRPSHLLVDLLRSKVNLLPFLAETRSPTVLLEVLTFNGALRVTVNR